MQYRSTGQRRICKCAIQIHLCRGDIETQCSDSLQGPGSLWFTRCLCSAVPVAGDSSTHEHQIQRWVNRVKPYVKGWKRRNTEKQTNQKTTHPPNQLKKKAANNFLLICLHAPLGPQGGSEATVQPAELWHWLTSICPTVPRAASTLGEERALLGKTGHQASTGVSARGFSYTLDPAFYFPVPLNFTIKIKAMIFPTLHR